MNAPPAGPLPAVFLDRDGTLMEDVGYPTSPSAVHLIDGTAEALQLLAAAGMLRIVITNQSGISRGLLTEIDYHSVRDELDRQLSQHLAALSASYHCPHHESDGCVCRKPGLALYQQAAGRHDVDLSKSWCVGDRLSDLLPARALGARACLVLTGEGRKHQARAEAEGFHVEENLLEAVRRRILADDR